MCAILDADVASAVFTGDPAPGAREFRRWIESGRGRLAVGGRLRKELAVNLADPRGKLYPESMGAGCRRWLLKQRRLCAN